MGEVKQKSTGTPVQGTSQPKVSYEQLNQVAIQLHEQLKQARQELAEQNYFNRFKRLDYLFKVVENDKMFSADFLNTVIEEIEQTLTIPKEEIPQCNCEELEKVDTDKTE